MQFQRLDFDYIRRLVSDRATANHTEFVAEMFTALVLGRHELRDEAVLMAALKQFGGERIMTWTEE
jgi:hypothetical protein